MNPGHQLDPASLALARDSGRQALAPAKSSHIRTVMVAAVVVALVGAAFGAPLFAMGMHNLGMAHAVVMQAAALGAAAGGAVGGIIGGVGAAGWAAMTRNGREASALANDGFAPEPDDPTSFGKGTEHEQQEHMAPGL